MGQKTFYCKVELQKVFESAWTFLGSDKKFGGRHARFLQLKESLESLQMPRGYVMCQESSRTVLPNSTDRGEEVGTMRTTNHHKTWVRKPRLVARNCDNCSRWEDDEHDEGNDQSNAGIVVFP
ncbi:hypothetical protein TNCV_333291 [Trichonephila clavipes]|nr:hypothetical protein TNCV_333291 [Trichonephila clavipes]